MEVKTLLCDVEVVNKNPKYRIIKYNDEYLMIDLVSTWLTLFLPMMNWLIPKKYVKISKEEFENLKIVKPVKNNAFGQLQVAQFYLELHSGNILNFLIFN